jgi:replication factor C small subunit
MSMENLIEDDIYIDLIQSIGEYDFRIREGSNPRIQLEALLAKFLLKAKAD